MMKLISNFKFSSVTVIAIIAAFFALVVNVPVFDALYTIFTKSEAVSPFFVASIPLFFFFALNFIFNLFDWPYFTKPFFMLLLVVSSAVSYASYNYGIIFDDEMVRNIVETNTGEASSYISPYSISWIVLMGVLPAVKLAFTRIRSETSIARFFVKKLASMLISLIGLVIIAALFYQDYASVGRNNSTLRRLIIPTYYVGNIIDYTKATYFSTPIEYKNIGLDAKQSSPVLTEANAKPTMVLFLLGETARSQNYQLNGYERETNPYTKDLGVISFQNVASCGTATAVSVPCMFSNMDRTEFDRERADNQDSAVDIMKRAGVGLLWKENDGGDKNIARNITKVELDRSGTNPLCNGSSCFDMALFDGFEDDIAKLSGNRMVFFHLIGSHGPTYFQRYPKEMAHFQPDCPRADIENCSVEQIVNTYDNTIRYTDFVLSQSIEKLKALEDKYNTAVIYLSDHGESLGENGLFLHGMPYSLAPDYQTHVPMIVWMSEGFKQAKALDADCLGQEAIKNSYSHDNLFHSLLGIMDITTEAYDNKMDIFARCRTL
jgi:lipid A ethanolaminephosphotransferase